MEENNIKMNRFGFWGFIFSLPIPLFLGLMLFASLYSDNCTGGLTCLPQLAYLVYFGIGFILSEIMALVLCVSAFVKEGRASFSGSVLAYIGLIVSIFVLVLGVVILSL